MAFLAGATVFQSTYPNQSGRIAASEQFDAYLGAPWAMTAQVVYYQEGQWPNGINDINPVGTMAQNGIFMVICVKPSRSMTVAEYNNLAAFIALLQANHVQFVMTLWQEPNTDGASGAFPSAAAYKTYVQYYIGALRAAGVTHMYKPALNTAGAAVSWYPGDANVDQMGIDYYYWDFLKKNATLGSLLNVAANHSSGPIPVWLTEWGLVDGSGTPSSAKFDLWAVNQVQVPLLTYVNQGGTLGGTIWYDAGTGSNQIDNTTPGPQKITMLNVAATLANAEPPGAFVAGNDYPDFLTPQANATAISTTGAPLLALSGSLATDLTITLKGGQSVSVPNLLISQLGYEIQISSTVGNGDTNPFVIADMQWSDPASGLIVAEEQWCLPCADAGAINTFNGTGPTKAAQLSINFTNLEATEDATVTVVMLTNSRVYLKDRWLQTVSAPSTNYAVSGGRMLSGVVASWSNQQINAGATVQVLLPLYAGDVYIYMDQNGVSATNFVAKLQVAPTSRFGTASMWSGSPTGGVGTGISAVTRWPRAPLLLTVVNSGAVNAFVNLKAIALDEAH